MGEVPFQTTGVDYAGPIKYQHKKSEKKAYIYTVVYSCSLTRLELYIWICYPILPQKSSFEGLNA
jgi:hypothetical protein